MSDKLVTVSGAQTLYNDARNRIENINDTLDTKVGYATVEDGYLILKASEDSIEEIAKLTGFGGGGGGGGGSNPAILTVTNSTPWGNRTTISNSSTSCEVSLTWSSLEGGISTNDGTMVIKTKSQTLKTFSIKQGTVTVDVREYLNIGENVIFFTISDIYGNSRTLGFTVIVTLYYLESIFDESTPYFDTEDILFTYKPVGSGNKHMIFKLDGDIIGEEDILTSNETQFFYISPETWATHGVHELEAYFIDENGNDSNILNFNLMCIKTGDSTPIISTHFDKTSAKKYETIDIPFIVYNPSSLISDVTLTLNGKSEVRTDIKNKEIQHWTYRVMDETPLNMKISVGPTELEFNIGINGSIIPISPSTSGLGLYLTSAGRDNASENRDVWEYGDVRAQFTDFTWADGVDGWVYDKDGYVALTVKGDSRVYIPYQIFRQNFVTNGKTIEFEFSTSNVNDYTATVIECYSGKRGIIITAQDVTLRAQKTSLSTQFKEDEHVRISFVVDPAVEDRMMLCYINGILSGVVEYQENEFFNQTDPVGITIGSNDVTTNVYNIRVYNRALTRKEILDNWICDKQNSEDLLSAYEHNNIYDDDTKSKIIIEKLPLDLPYMVVLPQRLDGTHTLSQKKNDKIPCDGYYVDPLHHEKDFTFVDAEMAVQGTSSEGYPRKNYKIKFKKDKDNPLNRPNFSWKYTQTGRDVGKWAMNDTAIPVNTFCFKADFASSEGANNVELVRLYNNLVKSFHKTPPQTYSEDAPEAEKAEKDKVRVGIDGFPILMFYNDGNTISFLGKYNFNNDKSTENVFGFEDGDECWEIGSNDSELSNWRSDVLTTEDNPLKWKEAFEDRYPDKGDAANITQLQALSSWIVTTNRNNIFEKRLNPDTQEYETVDTGIPVWADLSRTTYDEEGNPIYHGAPLPEPEVLPRVRYLDNGNAYYEDFEYDEDNGDYRLSKFRKELPDHFNVNSSLFYYLFTEFFLMVDSRAKNAFPTIYQEEGKWCWIPYDMDTALGINNEGKLTFGYSLEDTDILEGGKNVYNGQYSVMWNNVRDGFPIELKNMYSQMVAAGLKYDNVEKAFEDHQSKWPEAVFNEDAFFKYIQPYKEKGEPYLEMCLGSKAEQRKWWLYNRFRYIDSKYSTGESDLAQAKFRAYSSGDLEIIPYADIYARVKFGNTPDAPFVMKRAFKNDRTPLHIALGDQTTDLDCYICSADQLKEIGDLSVFNPGTVNLAAATKLQKLKVGKNSESPNLTELTLGNNILLTDIDARNCINLPKLDVKNCSNLSKLYLEGCTSLTSVELPNGGMLKTLHLPANMTSLTIKNQPKIEEFVLEGYSHLQALVLDTVSQEVQRDTIEILHSLQDGANVQLYNVNTKFNSVLEFQGFINDLNRMDSYDGVGPEEHIAQIIGTATILNGDVIESEYLEAVNSRYTNLDVIGKVKKTIKFFRPNGVDTYEEYIRINDNHVGDTVTYSGSTPSINDTETIHYLFDGWSVVPNGDVVYSTNEISDIVTSLNLYPHFIEVPIYTVAFYNYNGTPISYGGESPYLGKTIGVGDIVIPNDLVLPSWGSVPLIGWGTIQYGSDDIELSNGNIRVLKDVDLSDIPERRLDVYAIMDWPLEEIWVDTPPIKRDYYASEYFDPTGMIVMGRKTVEGNQHIPAVLTKYLYYSDKIKIGQDTIEISIPEKSISINYDIRLATSMTLTSVPEQKLYLTSTPSKPSKPKIEGTKLLVTFTNSNLDNHEEVIIPPVDGLRVFVESLSGEEFYDEFLEAGTISIWYNYYNLSDSYQVRVVENIDPILENNTWQTIRAACDSGLAQSYWHIGQMKKVHVGAVKRPDEGYLKEDDYYFRIVGFDHNKDVESPGVHTITFGLAELRENVDEDVRVIEVGQAATRFLGTIEYRPENGCSHSFGKEDGCHIKQLCDNYFIYLPDDLRPYIKTVTKWQLESSHYTLPELAGIYPADTLMSEDVQVFIPSLCEITSIGKFNPASTASESAVDETGHSKCKQFEYYEVNVPGAVDSAETGVDELIKYSDSGRHDSLSWWLRSFNLLDLKFVSSSPQPRFEYMSFNSNGKLTSWPGNTGYLLVPFFNI